MNMPAKKQLETFQTQQATVDAKELATALRYVLKGAIPKATVPILASVLIAGEPDHITLFSTDLNTTLRCSVGCAPESSFPKPVVVPQPKALLAMLKGQKGAVTLSVEQAPGGHLESLHLKVCGATMPASRATDWPKMVDTSEIDAAHVFEAGFAAVMDYVSGAVSTDETRPHLNVMVFTRTGAEYEQSLVAVCSTMCFKVACPTNKPIERDFQVPLQAAKHVMAACRVWKGEPIYVGFKPASCKNEGKSEGCGDDTCEGYSHIVFDVGPAEIVICAPDTTFPPWQQVIPRKDDAFRRFTISAEALNKAAEKAEAHFNAAQAHGHHAAFSVEDDKLKILADTVEAGRLELEEEIENVEGDWTEKKKPFVIGFNTGLLQLATRVVAGPIHIGIQGELDPMRIDGEGFTAVVMPARI